MATRYSDNQPWRGRYIEDARISDSCVVNVINRSVKVAQARYRCTEHCYSEVTL
jgi:hypothetical protein